MADNRAYDSLELDDMALPYAPNAGPLINKKYFTSGLNCYTTWGGTLKKRPGVQPLGTDSLNGLKPVRLWVYETIETTPYVYLVGSFFDGSHYKLYYSQISSLGAWTLATERRGSNTSDFPHEGAVRRGKLYLKAFPAGGVDPDNLGSIYLDGTGGTMATHDWGALGPQVPVALTDPGTWTPSAHAVTVLNGWIYTYTWVKASGQETNRAPLQTNPDADPSDTGDFVNLIPDMTVQGHADPTEYPYINMYRTTDGGGTFYFLYQIANTGPGSISFQDTYLASGSGNMDPTPDADLDTQHQSPSLTSNSPPPAVAPPLVTGVDAIQRSTRVVVYAARLWYAIGDYLFYSGNEEIDEGVPEECFPSGLVSPNFFLYDSLVTQLVPTPDGNLIMTRRDSSMIYGTSRAVFNSQPFLGNMGAAQGQSRAACTASDSVAWLTQDYNIAVVRGGSFAILNRPLGFAIKNACAAGAEVDLQFWNEGDKEYLIVACERADDTAQTQWFVYDLDRARRVSDDFWMPPWMVKSTCLAVGGRSATDTQNRLYVALWNGTDFSTGCLDYTGVSAADYDPTTGDPVGYGWNLTTSLLMVPLGDHVNQLRAPNLSPDLAAVMYERTQYTGDVDPAVTVFLDDLFTDPITVGPAQAPARRPQSKGYLTRVLNQGLNQVTKYAAIQWTAPSSTLQAEVHKAAWVWLPESGA